MTEVAQQKSELAVCTEALVFWTAVERQAAGSIGPYREQLRRLMAEQGSERQAARGAAGKLGTVTLAGTESRRVTVTDPAALLAWVRQRHPDWITEVIAPHRLDALKAYAKAAGDPVDRGGEVIPGLAVTSAEPYLQVKLTDAGMQAAAYAVRAALPDSLTAGDQPEGEL